MIITEKKIMQMLYLISDYQIDLRMWWGRGELNEDGIKRINECREILEVITEQQSDKIFDTKQLQQDKS